MPPDLADLSLGFDTDDMIDPSMNEGGFMLKRATPGAHTAVEMPVATSWNLRVPHDADQAIREERIDLCWKAGRGRPAPADLSRPGARAR